MKGTEHKAGTLLYSNIWEIEGNDDNKRIFISGILRAPHGGVSSPALCWKGGGPCVLQGYPMTFRIPAELSGALRFSLGSTSHKIWGGWKEDLAEF